MEEETKHPKPDRWWNRKWKMAVFGGVIAAGSLIAGFAATFSSPELGKATEPFAQMGLWFGFGVILTFVLPASAENIADKIWSKK